MLIRAVFRWRCNIIIPLRFQIVASSRCHLHTDNKTDFQLVSTTVSRLSESIGFADIQQLRNYGTIVIDNAFGTDFCRAIVNEMNALHNADALMVNHTHLVTNNNRSLIPKTGIYETKPYYTDGYNTAPLYQALCDDTTILRSMSRALPASGLSGHSVKFQVNIGDNGSCFPMHFDGDRSIRGERRIITMVAYLNDGWTKSDGGQLRLYPLPYQSVDIQPIMDRLVIFPSTTMLHRVLPTNKRRYCFTIWMTANDYNDIDYSPSMPTDLDNDRQLGTMASSLCRLFHQRVYPHYCKLIYSDEWTTSLRQSHNVDSVDTAQMIQCHNGDIEIIKKALSGWTAHVPNGLLPMPLPQSFLSTGNSSYPLAPVLDESHRPYLCGDSSLLRSRLKLHQWRLHQFI